MNDELEAPTYKKWFRKYSEERFEIVDQLYNLGRNGKIKSGKSLKISLPHLLSLPVIYEKASVQQKHLLLRGMFKYGLTYSEGIVRTHSVNPVFSHNLLIIK